MTLTVEPATPYGVHVAAIDDARKALRRLDALDASADTARAARNDAIWRAHTTDGMTPPAIMRALNEGRAPDKHVSESMVRNAITRETDRRR